MKRAYLITLILLFMLGTAAVALAAAKSDVSPDAALKMLREGNNRFASGLANTPTWMPKGARRQ